MARVNRWRQLSLRAKILSGIGGFFLLIFLLGVIGYLLTDIPPVSAVATNQSSSIRYADGSEIGRVGAENRKLVSLNDVSEPAQKAVLAAEDRGFYSEPGISPRGIFRALVANLKGGGVQQGGSTITQQYAKNAYLTHQRTFSRKIKEFFISLKLSHKLSKDQILENYLNTIYFGRGASGIEVASETYFNKPAKDLTVAEGAVLAASIRSPAAYDPTRHPERAQARWKYVLDGMVKKRWLTQQERSALSYPKVLAPGKGGGGRTNDRSGWKGYVIDQVEEELARNGFTEDRLSRGGLIVQTTLRNKAQAAAVEAVTKAVPPVSDPKDQHSPQAALVSISPGTGEVWAYYGGSIGEGGIDFASADDRRLPGSSMKPYVLATALQEGKGLGTRYDGSSPQTICGQPIHNDSGDPPLGQTDLVKGLALSVNTVYFRLACDVGPKKVAALAHAAGVTAPLSKDGQTAAGIALGIYDVSVMDQATGYATFAAHGQHADTHFVKSVKEAGGATVYQPKVGRSVAFGQDIAADATYAMQQVVQSGTGTRAQLAGRPVAGKTGTTQDNKDAWFCGFTPQLATAVWVGRQDRTPLKGALGVSGGVYGGTVPAGVFKGYMDVALQDQKVLDFPPRANVGKNASIGNGGSFSPRPASGTPSPSPLPTDLVTLPPVQPSPSQPPPSPEPSPSETPPPSQSPQPDGPPSPVPSPAPS
jgi:membrane peptidoglycan carboxypeptidase